MAADWAIGKIKTFMGRAEATPNPTTGQDIKAGGKINRKTKAKTNACAPPKTCYRCLRTMPTYDYECQKCGNRFEVVQSMNDAKLKNCPDAACDGQVKRLLGTGAGIIFKGSGFYQTDYRSSSYQAAAKSENGSPKKESPAKTEPSPTASTPSAPAPPPAPKAQATG